MTVNEILKQLKVFGDENTKRTFMKHGAIEPFFGVKVADLKKIVKIVKKDHELSLQLYATGNSDAMYLAGLIADETQITKEQLEDWADKAYWYMISEYTVPWIAAESKYGFELGLKWIKSDQERIASAGWSVFSSFARINNDDDLDIEVFSGLLDVVAKDVHKAQNRVRYAMNGFVIAVGTFIKVLTQKSIEVADTIGKVEVNMGGTSCKVPLATDYIQKVIDRDIVGKKRKSARC